MICAKPQNKHQEYSVKIEINFSIDTNEDREEAEELLSFLAELKLLLEKLNDD